MAKQRSILNKEGAEMFRISLATAGFALLALSALEDEDDNSIIGQIISKSIRDGMSLVGAISLTTWTSTPRTWDMVQDISDLMTMIGKMERYKNTRKGYYKEGDLKFPNQAKRTFKFGAIRQFEGKKKKDNGQGFEKGFNSGASKGGFKKGN